MQFVSVKNSLLICCIDAIEIQKNLEELFFATISIAVGCRSKVIQNPITIFHRCDIVYKGAATLHPEWNKQLNAGEVLLRQFQIG